MAPGTLYLIPTPIGNVEDLSPRARRLLAEVDVLAAEDTRETRALLSVLGIQRPVATYHDHNERQRAPALVADLLAGRSVGLVSDAGTPLLDDPGHHLVLQALEAGVPVVSVPGPSAAITALVGSGLPVSRWCYVGFLPRSGSHRRASLEPLRLHPGTLVILESPHRLAACLETLLQVLGDRPAVVAANLTKRGEAWVRGTLATLEQAARAGEIPRAEYTLVVGGYEATDDRAEDWRRAEDLAVRLLAASLPPRSVRDLVAGTFDLPAGAVYRLSLIHI